MTSGSRSVLIVTLGNLSAPAVALLTAPLLARALGGDGRGELAAATAPLMLAVAALTVGIPEALTYFTARHKNLARRTVVGGISVSVGAGLGGVALVALLAPSLAAGDIPLAGLILLCTSAAVPALITGCLRGVARGQQRWMAVAFEQLISAVFKLGFLGGLFLLGELSVFAAAIILSAGTFVGCLSYLVLLRRSGTPSDQRTVVETRKLLRYGTSMWLGSIAGVALSRLDQTLILPLSNASVLGVYAVAVSLADAARVFNLAVRDVIFSKQSAVIDDASLASASRLSTLVTITISVAVTLGSYLLVVPIFGSDFAAVPSVVAVLLIGTVLGNPGSVVAAGLSARGRPVLRSIALTCGVAVNLGLLFVLVPAWGALGAAAATSIANVATGVLVLVFAYRFFNLTPASFLKLTISDVRDLASTIRRLLRRS